LSEKAEFTLTDDFNIDAQSVNNINFIIDDAVLMAVNSNGVNASQANLSTINASLIIAENISGYQETSIAGANISLLNNVISTEAEPIPSDINFSSINVSKLVIDDDGTTGDGIGLLVPSSSANFRNINISQILNVLGSELYLGNPFNLPNNFNGGPPRSIINFWEGTSGNIGLRMGINVSNIAQMKLETQFGNVSRFNININNTSVLDIYKNSTKIHNDLFVNTINNSFLNTSFITCGDEASFGNGVNVTGEVSCDELDTDQVYTINVSSSALDAVNITTDTITSFQYNISDSSDDTEASFLLRDGTTTRFIHTGGQLRFECDELQTSGVANFSTINTSNISGYQETLIAGANISIVGNTISSAGEPLPTDPDFSSVNTSTLNASIVNGANLSTATMVFTSDFNLQSFGNVLSLTKPLLSVNEVVAGFKTKDVVTKSLNTSSLNVDGFTTLDVVTISLGLNSTNNNLFNINSSGTANISQGNFSVINASNLSTATMNFGADFTFDTFSNTLTLITTPEEAVSNIETNGLDTASVNTSSLNVDGSSTLDIVSVSIGLNSLVGNINTINSSGTANISQGNFSTIIADNISGYQETLIAGDNISIVGNTISSTGGGGGTAETLGEQVFYAVSSVDVLIGNVITYLSTFNTTPKTNTDLYTFTNNNTINILKSGFYKINFNCNFHNVGYNERTTIRTSVMLNGISDITSGGQASAYLRNNTVGPRGTTTGALFYELTAGDYIQLQNGINKAADTDFDTNFNSEYEFTEGSSIMITRMDINAVTADGTFLQGKLTAGDNITISGDVISATGGGALPATANFSEISVSNINVSTINGGSTTGFGVVAAAKIDSNGTNLFVSGCSVTRTATGRYTLTFDTARPGNDYVVQLSTIEPTNTIDDVIITFDGATATTTQFSYSTHEQDNGTNPGTYRDRAHFVSVVDIS
jgi:hypothetical protein